MVDEKEVNNPGESPKDTAEQGQLTDRALEKVAGGGPNDLPTESVTITFQKVEW